LQKLIISNVNDVEYKDIYLNEIFDPSGKHKQSFEFKNSSVNHPFTEGGGKLSVSFYILQPGKASYPYHYHKGNEEVFYIISGQGTLKTNEGDRTISEGDIIIMPANENGAHMLINTSSLPLTYVDIHTISQPEVVVYPETEKIMIMAGDIKKSFKLDSAVNYLEGE